MANRSTVNRLRTSMKLRALMATRAVLFALAVFALAFLFLPAFAHGQNVNASAFQGAGRGDLGTIITAAKATTANGGGCAVDVNITCVIEVGADLSIYEDGTLPTLDARTIVIDYRQASGPRMIVGGSSSLTALGGAFGGGTVANPIVFPDGTCATAPAIAFTSQPTTGFIYSASTVQLCISGTSRVLLSSGVNLGANGTYSWGTSAGAGGDTFLSRDGAANIISMKNSSVNQKFRVYGTTVGPNYIEFSSESVCGVSTANTGKLCFQYSDNTLKGSTNGGATFNISAPTTTNAPNLNGFCTGTATASSTIGVFNLGAGAQLTCTGSYASNFEHLMTSAGTISKLYVKCGTAGVNASSGVFTVMKNGGAQTVTATIGTATSINDTAHSFAYVAGDGIGVRFTTQAGETLANCEVSVE